MYMHEFNFSFPLLCGLIIATCNYLADILRELKKNNPTPSEDEIKYNYCREMLRSWIEVFATSVFEEEEDSQESIRKLKIAMGYLSIWLPCIIGYVFDENYRVIYGSLIWLSVMHIVVKSICHFKTKENKTL